MGAGGAQLGSLDADDDVTAVAAFPHGCFALCEGDEVEAVYAYCNLHSLWKA